ncbi:MULTISPECIES: hypothetical protein [unclassified Limnothrix]|nr:MULTISPECIES: hypothetical protein [unclassified Limnothrix]MBD2190747.1 hypothetical protein [Limnothrix sp. FACHB-1088]
MSESRWANHGRQITGGKLRGRSGQGSRTDRQPKAINRQRHQQADTKT